MPTQITTFTYILQGISKGYRIGYDYNKKTRRATSNFYSTAAILVMTYSIAQVEEALHDWSGQTYNMSTN